jgi:GT2 family glycosyltransferase
MKEGIKENVDSVLEIDYPDLEVIFVDNGSTDESASYVKENYGAKIKVIRNTSNLGFSEGFNTGIRASKGKYVVLLSNDMTVDRGLLKPVIRVMETDLQVGLIGFKRLVRGTNNLLDGIGGDLYLCGRVKPIGGHEIDKGQYNVNIDNLDFIGGAFAIRRDTLRKAGLLDSDFKVFAEDIDLCFRIRKSGYKTVYLYEGVIWHRGQATLRGMDPKGSYLNYMFDQNRIRYSLIHFTLRRILAMFLIDTVWFLMAATAGKKILLRAYLWNLRNIAGTLHKRLAYGPSPPFGCKSPIIPFRLSDLQRRIGAIIHSN